MNDFDYRCVSGLKSFLSILFLFFVQTISAALPDFTLTVTHTNETCTANGSVTFTISNATPGASILYTIYHLPDTTTPIATLSTTTFTGLVAGNYRIIATQSLNNQSVSQQQDVEILDLIVDLEYVVNGIPEICGNDGQLFAVPISGTAVAYEIISGPVIRPLQSSNTFIDLPAGNYTVRVFDNCGEGLVHTYILGSATAGVAIDFIEQLTNCETITVSASLVNTAGNVIKYPLTIQTIVTQPTGPPLVFNNTIGNGSSSNATFTFILPFTTGANYMAHTEITDGCGNVYINDTPLLVPELVISPQMFLPMGGCNNYQLVITVLNEVSPVTVDFLVSPPGFNPIDYNPNHPGPFNTEMSSIYYYNPSLPLPEGTYTVEVTDACGRMTTQTAVLEYEDNPGIVSGTNAPGCTQGMGSLAVSSSNGIVSAQLVAAPAAYQALLPLDLQDFIESETVLMNNLPAGEYQFTTLDACEIAGNVTINVIGYESGATNATIVPHCDSFDFLINHIDNLPAKMLWLQKYYPASDTWGHPITGSSGGPIGSGNAISITNNVMTTHIQSSGLFRVVKQFSIFGDLEPCEEVIYNFEHVAGPRIVKVYTVGCQDGNYNSIVEATGFGPLIYRITTKDGLPFFIGNGNSAVFTGLEPGVYNFQVEDACGNILNSVFDISNPVLFAIQPLNLCPGQSGALTVPIFPLINYEWWKEGSPNDILSTTNSLPFSSFDIAANAGLYHVRIIYPGQQSCVDLVLDFTVSGALGNPDAGNDATVTLCEPQGAIDLFSFLDEAVDNFGVWDEMTTSGSLNGNVWNSNIAPGNYQFKYTVDGLCNTSDESLVTINLREPIEIPQASANAPACESNAVSLTASLVDGANYQWNGPNGFSSNAQNPVIENASAENSGTYTVHAIVDGCASESSSIVVSVAPQPEFTLAETCVDGAFILTATPTNPSNWPDDLAWSGPNNFTAVGNPVVITGQDAGNYLLTATSADGCTFSTAIEIQATLCAIPKGISPNDDGDNDNWNLSGLDVDHVKIFNRYGMLMYEKARYVNEWNGQDKHGCELPSATYYYLVDLANGEVRSGWVYLMRN